MSAFVINPYSFAKFVPTDISNLVVWLDAGKGLFDATSGGSAVTTDASTVARWEDQSGNGNNFTQSGSSQRPQLKTSIQNGLNVLRLTNSTFVVCNNNALFRNISGATVFGVRKCASNPTGEQNIFRANINNSSPSRIFFAVGFGTAGRANAGGRRLDTDSFSGIVSTNNVSTTAFEIQSAVYDYANTNLFLYFDGSQEASNTSWQTAGSTSDTDSSQIRVGTFNGDIAEVIAYNRALSTAERENVEKYLNEKYAIY